MKAIGIVGSPRKNGNTEILTNHTLKAIAEEGIDTELIRLAGLDIKPCTGCIECKDKEDCPLKDDLLPIYNRMKEADAIILASPVYFSSVTGLMKSFMDRAGYIGYWRKAFQGKVGGPLVVGRRSGHLFTHTQLTNWFQVLGFFMASSTYWNVAFGGREKGEVEGDEEGLKTVWNFGKNMALLLKKLKA